MLRLIIGNKVYSSWSLRGWLAVKQSGLPFEEVVVPLYDEAWEERKAQADLAPSRGKVPMLWDGDVPVWESLAIIDYLDGLIRDLGLTGVVHRIGPVREADLPRWQNACDIFSMPNREINGDNEGFGMVFIEAAACGKPSLAGLAGGTGSAVLHGETGLRVDGTSVDAVADGLRSLLTQPDLTRDWGQRALQRVEHEFSRERVAEKTRQLNMTITRS